MRIRTGLVLGLLLVLPVAGCARGGGGDNGVATAGGAKPSASASAGAGTGPHDRQHDQEQMLKFAQCMRDHGIPMDDPQFDTGGVSIMMPQGSDKSKVDAAQQQCKQYLPNGGEPMTPDPQMQEQMRKFAQCMRDQGITGFPDPSDDGGIKIDAGTLGADPQSEQFKKAESACSQYRPAPKGGGGGDSGEHVATGGKA